MITIQMTHLAWWDLILFLLMLSVIMSNVILLNVVASLKRPHCHPRGTVGTKLDQTFVWLVPSLLKQRQSFPLQFWKIKLDLPTVWFCRQVAAWILEYVSQLLFCGRSLNYMKLEKKYAQIWNPLNFRPFYVCLN